MAGKERNVVFISKVPALIGEALQRNNRFITAPDLIKATGLERKTVHKWLSETETIKYLDGDTVKAFRTFFAKELKRNISLDELVDIQDVNQ